MGTVSIEKSERLSSMLTKRGIRHEVLNAKNHHREAMIVAEAGAKGSVTIATNMAGRGTDIKLGGNPEFRTRKEVGTEASSEEYEKAYKRIYAKTRLDYEEVKNPLADSIYSVPNATNPAGSTTSCGGVPGARATPGVSRFFLSLDDDLMRLFANDNMKNIMGKLGMSSGEPLFHPWLNKTIERGPDPGWRTGTLKSGSTSLNMTTFSMSSVPSSTISGTKS